MEFLEAFKSRYEQYYKRTEIATTNRDTKDAAINANRRQTRANLLSQRRNIDTSILSPVATPAPKNTTKRTKNNKDKTQSKPMDRLAMLKIWKLEKENKKKEQKKKQKPIFRLGAPQHVGFPTEIPSFAPPNHKFKVPSNINPINMKPRNPAFHRVTRSQKPITSPPLPLASKRKKNAVPKKTPLQDLNVQNTKAKKSKNKFVRQNACDATSSSQEGEVAPLQESNVRKKRRSYKRKSAVTEIEATSSTASITRRQSSRRKSCKKTSSSELPSDLNSTYEMLDCSVAIEKIDILNTAKTPESKRNISIYISPFVTTSRGKGSMRKENQERSIRGLPSFTEFETPNKEKNAAYQVSGAAYFHTVLNNQISKLEELCKIWQEYKDSTTLTEDVEDSINVTIGQANLLMHKKFQQFKGLILSCETGEGQEKPVTCEDLQGFWDMIYMQVENLNTRFNRLDSLKESNWEEIAPIVVVPKVQKKRTNTKKPSVKSSTSIGLKAAIEAARKKKQSKVIPDIIVSKEEKSEETVFNGGFFVVRSPVKTPTPRRTRASLRVSILATETKKKAKSIGNPSASLSMTRASQIAKSVENLSVSFTLPIPGKSILKKMNTSVATPRGSRIVLFKDGNLNE